MVDIAEVLYLAEGVIIMLVISHYIRPMNNLLDPHL